MDVLTLLCEQAQWAHQVFRDTSAGITAEQAHWQPPGRALPLSAAMAHAVTAEDSILHILLQGKEPLHQAALAGRTGISEPRWFNDLDWARSVQVDLPALHEYAAAVFAATDQYLAGLSVDELSQARDLTNVGLGVVTVAWIISALLIGHMHNLAGEISAIKGAQGLQGYPF